MEVTILGRGKSLSKLKHFKSNSNEVILVNSFWKSPELSDNAYVNDPIINNFLKKKKVTLVMSPIGIGEGGKPTPSPKEFDEKYNVQNKYNCMFSKGRRSNLTRTPGWQVMPESSRLLYQSIGDAKIKKTGDFVPGSLAYACLIAISEMNASNIHIFGLDFYEKGYLQKQNHSQAVMDSHYGKNAVIQNKIDFCNFFNFLSDISFDIYTAADFTCSSPHISVL
tara:strand:- start:3622 stop:4290 length:669 start_codon:yes stop_codon:yes gene_type:complete